MSYWYHISKHLHVYIQNEGLPFSYTNHHSLLVGFIIFKCLLAFYTQVVIFEYLHNQQGEQNATRRNQPNFPLLGHSS